MTRPVCPDCDFVVPEDVKRPGTSIAAHRRRAHGTPPAEREPESPTVLRGGRWVRQGLTKRWTPHTNHKDQE